MGTTTDRGQDGVRFTSEDGLVTAIDTETGVAASGETRSEALGELADALRLHEGGGEQIETEAEERKVLREIGIDPDEVEETKDLPEFMQ